MPSPHSLSRLINLSAIALTTLASANAQVITTIAGGGFNPPAANGIPATQTIIEGPQGVTTDSAGNVYFYDTGDFEVRQVNGSGLVNTVAGNGQLGYTVLGSIGDGGKATSAGLGPAGVFAGLAFDPSGNLYIADPGNGRVRKVDTNGIITTFAGGGQVLAGQGDGGKATSAGLGKPAGLATDSAGNVYIADFLAGNVRKVDTQGIIHTYAGGGSGGDGVQATSSSVAGPYGLAMDSQGNLYIAQATRVRMVNPQGIITTVAGGSNPGSSGNGGSATAAQFSGIIGIAVDKAQNLYIADRGNYQVRVVSNGIINAAVGDGHNSTGGDGGLPVYAGVSPVGLAVDASGNLFISDAVSNDVRKVNYSKKAPGITVSANSLYFSASVGHLGSLGQYVEVQSVNGPVLSYTTTVSTQDGANWLYAGSGGSTGTATSISISNSPTKAGTYHGTVTLTPALAAYPPVTIQVTYAISATAPATPVITDVENGASFQSGYMGGAIWTVKGTNLASISGSDNWNNSIVGGMLPTVLDGVTVTFGGVPAYISYLSATQINVVTPSGSTATPDIVVTNNGATSAHFGTGEGLFSPAFFTWPQNQVVATRTDYSYAVGAGTFSGLTTAAAKPGDVLILWGTGFGPTTPSVGDGVVVPSDQEYACSTTPTVSVNGVNATVYGCALAAGYAGLYQVAIQVPGTLPAGTYPIVATSGQIDGVSSPGTVVLAVHP